MNRATTTNDHTVLSLACAGGYLAVVELLLAHGAKPDHILKVSYEGNSYRCPTKDGGQWGACPGRKIVRGDIFRNKNSLFFFFFF